MMKSTLSSVSISSRWFQSVYLALLSIAGLRELDQLVLGVFEIIFMGEGFENRVQGLSSRSILI